MAVKLGTFVFQDLEIPEQINFGGPHIVVKHQLIGGGRILDAMGDDPAPIEWAGIFLYGQAANRARQLDAMKVSGATFQLTWGTFSRRVKILRFDPVYKYEFQIPYRIAVEVLPSKTDQGATQPLDRVIQGDFDTLGQSTLSPAATSAVAAARGAVSTVAAASSTGQIADAPLMAAQPAVSSAQVAVSALSADRASAEAALPQASLAALPGLSAADYAASLTGLVGASAGLADADTALAYMGRIAGNLALAGG